MARFARANEGEREGKAKRSNWFCFSSGVEHGASLSVEVVFLSLSILSTPTSSFLLSLSLSPDFNSSAVFAGFFARRFDSHSQTKKNKV
jgi:hypothetical protein